MIREINSAILREASRLRFTVKDSAPSDIQSVLNQGELVVWSGASDRTIFGDASVNHAFRAIHDEMHRATRLGFIVSDEIELGRIQAAKYSGLLADLVWIEVSKQAEYFLNNGVFIQDQIAFTNNELKKIGWKNVA